MKWLLRSGFLVVSFLIIPACGDGDGCLEGAHRVCSCDEGDEGLQQCQADGTWEACDCSCQPQCGGLDCGDDGCGGSCGDCDNPPSDQCLDARQLMTFDAAGTCVDGRCDHESQIEECPYGCDAGACLADPCDGLDCSQPPGPCQAPNGQCVREPEAHCEFTNLSDGSACDDGLWCNGEEACQAGVCEAGTPPLDCSHLDEACNMGSCDETGQDCQLVPRPDGTDCQDQTFCNGEESCQAGICAAEAVDCSDFDSFCGVGECVEAWKTCVAMPQNEGADCSDELFCNGAEFCQSGYCLADPVQCPTPENACMRSVCDEASLACVEEERPDGSACDNRVLCTEADSCVQGECITGATSPDGTSCRDEDPCTINDTCSAGQCMAGETICDGMVVVLMYMDADNNLESYLVSDWHEMEAANVEDVPWLRVFVLMDRAGRGDSALYEVLNGQSQQIAGPELGLAATGMGEVNMGDGATVTAFIHDVKNHVGGDAGYYLMLSDHGDGWSRRSLTRGPEEAMVKGCCSDDSSNGDMLRNAELQHAIEGEGLLLISFDACLMGMAEVAYELRNDALVMVASQETEPGDGWAFTQLLSQFGASEAPSPEEFGRIVVDTYIDSYGSEFDELTQAVYDLTRMDDLAAAVNAVALELETLPASAFSSLCTSMDWYACFWGMCQPFTDLTHLISRAMDLDSRDNDIIYQTALDRLAETILYARHRRGHGNAHGMNVYFPCNQSYSTAYGSLMWSVDTHWDDMLQAH